MTLSQTPISAPFSARRGAFTFGIAALLLAGPTQATGQASTDPYVGFTAARAAEQATCEARFLELPSSQAFREHLRLITSEPHPAGSAEQVEVGNYLTRVMKAAGLDVVGHTYDVYLPQLTDDVEAWIETPDRMRLSNREPPLAEDRFSHHPGLLNGWNAFSGSGDVTGEVVYANFGRREDYEALDEMGIDLTGRIVIARYGGNFRGYKVKFAEERGAAGVIMFNDPGSSRAGAYPEGPMMNGETIQRGSVLTLPWTGDPLTPFEPALPVSGERGHVERLDPDDVAMPTIPVLPLGYLAAEEILSRNGGARGSRGVARGDRDVLPRDGRLGPDGSGSREPAARADAGRERGGDRGGLGVPRGVGDPRGALRSVGLRRDRPERGHRDAAHARRSSRDARGGGLQAPAVDPHRALGCRGGRHHRLDRVGGGVHRPSDGECRRVHQRRRRRVGTELRRIIVAVVEGHDPRRPR